MKNEVVIVSALRTPFGRFGGIMKDIPSVELGALVIREVINRVGLEPSIVDEVYYGTCVQEENALSINVVGRQALLKAGLPSEKISLTIDRACCSSITAVHLAYRMIQSGELSVVVAVGAENMSRSPYLLDGARWGTKLGHLTLVDNIFGLHYDGWDYLAKDAGEVAVEEGIFREEQDLWALRSQQRYYQAAKAGKFKDEIIPVEIPGKKDKPVIMTEDEQPRPDTTLESLSKLPTIYGSPTVTPGNAPGMNTGACAILLMSREKADELGLEPLCTVCSISSVASEPRYMAKGPAMAISKIMEKESLTIEDIQLIEINEAFAAVTLVSTKLLSNGDAKMLERIREKTNVNGGAIAIGHPVGASGARILTTLIYELRRRGGGKGVASICGGLCQGDAVLIEV